MNIIASLWGTLSGWLLTTMAWAAGHWPILVVCAVAGLLGGLIIPTRKDFR